MESRLGKVDIQANWVTSEMLQKFNLSGRPDTSDQPQDVTQGPVLLYVFTNELGNGAVLPQQVCTQYRTEGKSLCRSWVCRWVCYYSGHLDRLEKWTDKKLKMFNNGRCQILHHALEQAWGWPPGKQLGREGHTSFLSFLLDKVSMSKRCSHEPSWSCSEKSGDSRLKKAILSLCWAVVRSHLGFWMHFGGPQYKTDTAALSECTESSQRCLRD